MSVVVQTDKTVVVHAPSGTVLVAQVLGGGGNTSDGMQASVYDPQGKAADVFDRGNHTGTQPMSSIGNKKGKVLDDLIHLPSNTDLDTLITPNGYLLDADNIAAEQGGSILWVVETEHPYYGAIIGQSMQHIVSGKILMRWMIVALDAWQPWVYMLSEFDVAKWYNSTTAVAPNAVIKETGFARSVSSDEYKTGIEPMLDEYADAIVQGAQPIYYRSTCDADPDDWSYWGISAEQLATIDPRLVHWGHSTKEVPQPLGLPPKRVPDLDSPLKPVGVQYSRVVPALLNVVKRQGAALAALEARLAALEAQ